ncbi:MULTISPECIES: hypothetical protein [Nocardiopsis]|uniref:hypothetical protein n=1 Tax=Nocardiopsis TaxID=2013 RepID=UPI0003455B10|nr:MULTISPECIES: hypothetical protein [Nocardiopsis]
MNRLSNRPALRGRRGRARPPLAGAPASLAELACYWLLYVVALSAALLHWNVGNTGLALLCVLAAAAAVRAIVRTSPGDPRADGGPEQRSV